MAAMVGPMANNDSLRAMDIALQRMKATEVFVNQGNWAQASMLELIPAEGEQGAWFCQELKAAQQEAKAESRLQMEPGQRDEGHGTPQRCEEPVPPRTEKGTKKKATLLPKTGRGSGKRW